MGVQLQDRCPLPGGAKLSKEEREGFKNESRETNNIKNKNVSPEVLSVREERGGWQKKRELTVFQLESTV